MSHEPNTHDKSIPAPRLRAPKLLRDESVEANFTEALSVPAELKALESGLRELMPVQSGLDREALIYQAGWEAAQLQARGKGRDEDRSRSQWLWPSTTAVLAASLVFLLLSPTPPASSLQRAGIAPPTSPIAPPITSPTPLPPKTQTTRNQTTPNQTPPNQTPPKQRPLRHQRLPRTYPASASFLTLRDRALRQDFSRLDFNLTSTNTNTFTGGDYSPRPHVTRREMLQELLPSTPLKTTPARQRLFRWPTWNLGETS